MDTVNTLLDHEHTILILSNEVEAVPQIKIVPLPVKQSLGFLFLIDKEWVFWADFILDVECIDLGIPIFMGFWYCTEYHLLVTVISYEYFYYPVYLV